MKEPEKKSTTSAKSKIEVTKVVNKGFGDIRNFVTVSGTNKTSDNNSIKMPGVGASNIHGFSNLSTPANNVVKQVSNGNIVRPPSISTGGGNRTKSNSNSTIVVNKKSTTTSANVTNIDFPTEIKIFSGSGKSLLSSSASAGQVRNDDYSVVRTHWANKFPSSPTKLNKRSVIGLSPSKISKKQKIGEEGTSPDKVQVTDTINLDDLVSCPVCHKHMKEFVLNEHLDQCLLQQNKKDEKLQQCFVCNKEIPQAAFRDHVNNCFENNISDDEELAECEICNGWFSEKKMESHRKACIEKIFSAATTAEDIPETSIQTTIKSKSSSTTQCSVCNNFVDGEELNNHKEQCILKLIDTINEEHGLNLSDMASQKVSCLVCNKMVLKEELNTHLDECMSGVFDDKSFDMPSSIKPNKPESNHDCDNKNDTNKYNCPFCMDLYSELDMSGHLDQCLADSETNVNNKTILIDSFSSDEL